MSSKPTSINQKPLALADSNSGQKLSASQIITTFRHLLLLLEFRLGNWVGDPDRGNNPRIDDVTGLPIMTPWSIKRKMRDQLALFIDDLTEQMFQLYVARDTVLQQTNRAVAKDLALPELFGDGKEDTKAAKKEEESEDEGEEDEGEEEETASTKVKFTKPQGKEFMHELCRRYIDVRFFGQLITKVEGLRGPVQVSFGEGVEPMAPQTAALTRVAIGTEKELKKHKGKGGGMGNQPFATHALFRIQVTVNPFRAQATGFTEADYDLLVQCLLAIVDNDTSTARSQSAVRGLYEFRHNKTGAMGPLKPLELMESIKTELKDRSKPPTNFADYLVMIPKELYGNPDFEFRVLKEATKWTYEAEAA